MTFPQRMPGTLFSMAEIEANRDNPNWLGVVREWNRTKPLRMGGGLWDMLNWRHDMHTFIRRRYSESLRLTGKGNRAWKRAAALNLEPGTIIWPDYAMPRR